MKTNKASQKLYQRNGIAFLLSLKKTGQLYRMSCR